MNRGKLQKQDSEKDSLGFLQEKGFVSKTIETRKLGRVSCDSVSRSSI